MKGRGVLLLVADPAMQQQLSGLLHQWGYAPVPASSVEEAFGAIAHTQFLFSLVDMDLAGADGPDFLRKLRDQGGDPGPIVLMLSESNNIKRIEESAALGAHILVRKPFSAEELDKAIRETLSRSRRPWGWSPTEGPTARLQQEITLWRSPKMREVWEIIQQAARVDVTVLICGETGTGKDLVARGIHFMSSRRDQPFVKVNCAAVPRELLESEMFGHERGAFTGAHQLKIGKFESADRGTIFLDEIGDLHPALQAKLLHVSQDGEFSRVGGKSTIKVDVRVLAATNQDLERAVRAGRFREDLYYRLNVVQILVPPLRERPEEIPLLVNYFIERYSTEYHREGFAVPPKVMERLVQHSYPGNIRELENSVKRMIVLNDPFNSSAMASLLKADDNDNGRPETPESHILPLKEIARQAKQGAEREAISKVLEQTGWNRVRAAKLLKISYRALLYKIKDVGLDRKKAFPGTNN